MDYNQEKAGERLALVKEFDPNAQGESDPNLSNPSSAFSQDTKLNRIEGFK